MNPSGSGCYRKFPAAWCASQQVFGYNLLVQLNSSGDCVGTVAAARDGPLSETARRGASHTWQQFSLETQTGTSTCSDGVDPISTFLPSAWNETFGAECVAAGLTIGVGAAWNHSELGQGGVIFVAPMEGPLIDDASDVCGSEARESARNTRQPPRRGAAFPEGRFLPVG
jgi:hypothetical protein